MAYLLCRTLNTIAICQELGACERFGSGTPFSATADHIGFALNVDGITLTRSATCQQEINGKLIFW